MELSIYKGKNFFNNLINNKKTEKLTLWIMINMFYILVGSYLSTSYIITHANFAYGLIPFLFFNIVIGAIICKKGYCKKNSIHVFMIVAIILGIISTIFAINPKVSLMGFEYRDEGLLILIYYFSIMFLSSLVMEKHKKTIIFFILIIGIINCIVAIYEVFGGPNVVKVIHPSENPDTTVILSYTWARGFLINPNFFGTYMLLCLSYSIGLFIEEKSNRASVVYLILGVLFMYGLLISNTLSVVIGFLFVWLFCLIYCIKNKRIKRFVFFSMILFCIVILVHVQGKSYLLKDLAKTSKETIDMTQGNVKDTYGTSRIYIWRNTLQIVPKYMIHGAGIDNFYYAFGDEPLYSPGRNSYYDKAHNEYLQILIAEGALCLLVYLCIYGIVTYKGLKYSFKGNRIYLVLPIIGYLIQAFFNISVLEVASIFYIAMGLCFNNQIKDIRKNEDN